MTQLLLLHYVVVTSSVSSSSILLIVLYNVYYDCYGQAVHQPVQGGLPSDEEKVLLPWEIIARINCEYSSGDRARLGQNSEGIIIFIKSRPSLILEIFDLILSDHPLLANVHISLNHLYPATPPLRPQQISREW